MAAHEIVCSVERIRVGALQADFSLIVALVGEQEVVLHAFHALIVQIGSVNSFQDGTGVGLPLVFDLNGIAFETLFVVCLQTVRDFMRVVVIVNPA